MNPVNKSLLYQTIFYCLLLLFLGGCESDSSRSEQSTAQTENDTHIPFEHEGTLTLHSGRDLPSVTIDIEIADTDSARNRGLMQRTSLPPKSGMLFIFEKETPQSFWMANTPLSLDMFFADRRGRIIKIAKYTKPGSSEHIRSEEPAQYVLETPAGFADQHGIVEGDSMSWTRVDR